MNLDDLDFAIEKTIQVSASSYGVKNLTERNQLKLEFLLMTGGDKVEDCELVWRQLNDLVELMDYLAQIFLLISSLV